MSLAINPLSLEELAEEMHQAVWRRVEPPLWWDSISDYVIADGVLGDLRGHMVAGHVEGIRIVRNAYVVGAADWPSALFDKEPSHLSGRAD
uniref:Uncharacterized protein n=1 Tax=viral metagenome TaxID=1070528 RepID=A0A6H1ZJC7_9ZZZZ